MTLTRLISLLFILGLILSGFWYIGSALTGVLLLVAVVAGCRLVFTRCTWHDYALSKMMLVYIFWLFIVALTSPVPNTSMMVLPVLAGLPVIYLIASNSLIFNEIWKKLSVILFITAVGLASWGIWQVIDHVGYGHAVGPLVDRNAFAALMNLLWFPAAYLFLTHKLTANRWISLLLGSGLFIISVALFATASRGGIGTWLILLPIMLWACYKYSQSKLQVAIIPLIAMVAYLCSALLLHSSVGDRTLELAQDASITARLMMWQSTIKMALAHPLSGTGWGTFAGYYPAYRSPLENTTSGVSAHNDYLQLAAEGGIPAMLLQLGVMLGILFQLKRSLKNASGTVGLESTALLLGVLAIFIHAGVNFIFCFAFMNILAGLYLARAAQLVELPHIIKISSFEQIRPPVKRLLAGFILLLVTMPFALHLISQACLTGSQPGLKAINLITPKVTSYRVANFITTIYPQEYIAQQAMLQIAEQYLADNIGNNAATDDFKHQLLNETIERFDSVRARSANNPNIGVREAKMLITYRDTLGSNTALAKAHQVLAANLKADPYHANSMIMLARLQVAEGRKTEAIQTLQQSAQHILTRRDQQLLFVETLRQLAAPKIITELDNIEKQLALVRSDSETGKPHILAANFYEDIDVRLNAIAAQIPKVQ
ncbi:MAG: O-antigen ligase family protein [Pseudomonadota bacterium]